MKLSREPLVTSARIQGRVAELAAEVSRDYAGREVILVVVLKGGFIFAADLVRRITVPVSVDFIRARSYRGQESAGPIEFQWVCEDGIAGKHVLVLEDILDTGRTAAAILDYLKRHKPATLALCTLLDKPARREVAIVADYVGFTIDNHFVVGYGLDYDQQGRELPDVWILDMA